MANKLLSKTDQIIKVSKLVSGWWAKFFFIFWALWMAVRHRIGIKQGEAGKLRLRYEGKDFDFYSCYSTDLSVIDEVFIQEMYELPENISPKTIFDLGSNTGVTMKFFELRFPQAHIYAFEPDPQVFQALKRNSQNSLTVRTFNLAVTGRDREVAFYIHPKSPIVSSIMPRFAEQQKIRVMGKSLSTLTQELGINEIDLVKFDVEGAEGEIFSSFDTSKIKMLVGELHTDLAQMSLDQFKLLFPSHEFKIIKQMSPTRCSLLITRKEG